MCVYSKSYKSILTEILYQILYILLLINMNIQQCSGNFTSLNLMQ